MLKTSHTKNLSLPALIVALLAVMLPVSAAAAEPAVVSAAEPLTVSAGQVTSDLNEAALVNISDPQVAATVAELVDGVDVAVETSLFASVTVSHSDAGEVVRYAESLGAAAELDAPLYKTSGFPVLPVPNDPLWGQWYGAVNGNLLEAWGVTSGDTDVVIAVVDTGVAELPELSGRVLPGWSYFEGQSATVDPDNHGTYVAQVAAGAVNNSWGAGGTCPQCSILPVQVFDPVVNNFRTSSAVVAAGVIWAVDTGADIINLSLAGPNPSDVLAAALTYADANGVLLVASAGNNGENFCPGDNPGLLCSNRVQFPAGYPEVLSVGATDRSQNLYWYSSDWDGINVVAPGTTPAQNNRSSSQAFEMFTGTSSSSAFTAGVLGLVRSIAPEATREEIWSLLAETSDNSGQLIDGTWGVLRPADLAVRAASDLVGPPQVTDAPSAALVGSAVTFTGSGLQWVDTVRFAGKFEVEPTAVTSTSVTFDIPSAHSRELSEVSLVGPTGVTQPVPLLVTWPEPAISSFSVGGGGKATGGAVVTVDGQGFVPQGLTVTFDGEPVAFSRVSSSRLSFVVPSVGEGTYEVVVTAPDGSVSGQLVVELPLAAPDAPGAPQVVQQGRALLVTVLPPSAGPPPVSYVVETSPGGRVCTVEDPMGGSCFIDGIPAPEVFVVTARAVNSAGQSLPSPGSLVATRSGSPVGNLDVARKVSPDEVRLRGWTLDFDSADPIRFQVRVNGSVVVTSTTDVARNDVRNVFPGYGNLVGFDVTVPLVRGNNRVCVVALNVGPGSDTSWCRQVQVLSGSPVGNLDVVRKVSPDEVRLRGWAFDPDTADPIRFEVRVNGSVVVTSTTDVVRNDVRNVFPGYGNLVGFDVTVPLVRGNNRVCVVALNVGPGSNTSWCRQVAVLSGTPFGSFDRIGRFLTGEVLVRGWAIDPDTADPIPVHVYVNGRFAGAGLASRSRPDVGRAFAGYGNNHGFSVSVAAPRNARVCVFAVNMAGPGVNPSLGCRFIP